MRKQEIQQIYARFFNPNKSPRPGYFGFPIHSKQRGRLVWNSSTQGTYVRALHGELK
jgi:hypothetical protein